MNQRDAKFCIKAENRVKAFQAIKDLATHLGGGEVRYSLVTTADIANARTLEDAMWAWRWQVEGDEGGDVDSIMFEGEKLGDDEILLRAIAPYVEAGSYIEMQGEAGEIWRWVFDGTTMVEQNAKVTWGDS